MRLRLIWVGKTRDEHLRELIDGYLKRIERFNKCDVIQVREGTRGANERQVLASEERSLLEAVEVDCRLVLLDVEGEGWSSQELAKFVEDWQVRGSHDLAFLIGGHFGVSDAVKKRADRIWSLSRLTFTHEMARLLLVEQLYRAFTILRGLPYQK